MRHGSLFSGIGGFDLAADWMGWENVFHCEWNEFGKQVLKYYWPNAISYHDITKTDFTIHRGGIDILTGGFPCQPYSTAGKRLGKDDDRHLWPEMLRAIREIQPTWIVGENVRGLTNWNGGVVFDEVQADLEALGYEVQSFILPACAVNAPHRRDRVWIVAYRACKEQREQAVRGLRPEFRYVVEVTPNTRSEQLQERTQNGISEDRAEDRTGMDCGIERQGNAGATADANGNQRPERGMHSPGCETAKRHSCTCDARADKRPAWDNFPTQPPICSRNDGVPAGLDGITFPKWRNESIKAYGNAVVPQVVYQIFQAIEKYEKQ